MGVRLNRTAEPRQLAPPPDPPPRLGSRPLPAYRHVPGLTPHPVTHPAGHSHGQPEEQVTLTGLELPGDWWACELYLEGVDLFNRAFLWEAHEAWEAVWHAVGHQSTVGRYLQGLIQVAAALLKRHLGMEIGVRNLLAKSERNLEPARAWLRASDAERFMGLALNDWDAAVRAFLEADGTYPFLVLRD